MTAHSRKCDNLRCDMLQMDNDCRCCIHSDMCLMELEDDDPFLQDDWEYEGDDEDE